MAAISGISQDMYEAADNGWCDENAEDSAYHTSGKFKADHYDSSDLWQSEVLNTGYEQAAVDV